MGLAPLGLVPGDLAADLLGAFAERLCVAGQLAHLAGLRVECEAVCGQRLPEGRIGHHRGVPDALHGADRVAHGDRVDAAPLAGRLDAGVDLQMEALKKEGEAGRRKITQYTRYGTVLLATFQAIGISVATFGFVISNRAGELPFMDPLLPLTPVIIIIGLMLMFGSVAVYELIPSRAAPTR